MIVAHVICMNDSIEHVVVDIGIDAAQAKLEDLRKEHWAKNAYAYRNDAELYRNVCYWHIHTVDVDINNPLPQKPA